METQNCKKRGDVFISVSLNVLCLGPLSVASTFLQTFESARLAELDSSPCKSFCCPPCPHCTQLGSFLHIYHLCRSAGLDKFFNNLSSLVQFPFIIFLPEYLRLKLEAFFECPQIPRQKESQNTNLFKDPKIIHVFACKHQHVG